MTKSRIALLVITMLVVAGSTLGAPAAFAATPTHVSMIRTASVPASQLHDPSSLLGRPSRMTQAHDHVADPFADLLLG
jgi:hypothetical protein